LHSAFFQVNIFKIKAKAEGKISKVRWGGGQIKIKQELVNVSW
jgi:hypothetical protein